MSNLYPIDLDKLIKICYEMFRDLRDHHQHFTRRCRQSTAQARAREARL